PQLRPLPGPALSLSAAASSVRHAPRRGRASPPGKPGGEPSGPDAQASKTSPETHPPHPHDAAPPACTPSTPHPHAAAPATQAPPDPHPTHTDATTPHPAPSPCRSYATTLSTATAACHLSQGPYYSDPRAGDLPTKKSGDILRSTGLLACPAGLEHVVKPFLFSQGATAILRQV